jgi:hypothetical protein
LWFSYLSNRLSTSHDMLPLTVILLSTWIVIKIKAFYFLLFLRHFLGTFFTLNKLEEIICVHTEKERIKSTLVVDGNTDEFYHSWEWERAWFTWK